MTRSLVCALAVIAAVLAPIQPAPAKAPNGDNAVQTLANFPALQQLGKKDGKTIRAYLKSVATSYRAAGYGALAQALPTADELIALFGRLNGDADAREIKRARATLRHLATALASNPRVALPARAGETIPNYYGLAAAFVNNADRALKNLAKGKSVANFLRQTGDDASWITNLSGNNFSLQGSLGSVGTFSDGVTKTGAGTLVLSGQNTYTGATLINSGAITTNVTNVLSSGTGATLRFGSLNLPAVSGHRWVALPPEVEIPVEWADLQKITFADAMTTTDAETFPSGTRIVKAPLELPLPDGAVELANGTVLTPSSTPVTPLSGAFLSANLGGFTPLSGTLSLSGTLILPTPPPSPTPAE